MSIAYVAEGVPYPKTGDLVKVRLDPNGAWYDGTLIEIDSLHFTVNQSPFRTWRYGDFDTTWTVYGRRLLPTESPHELCE